MVENGKYDFFTSGIKKYKIDHYAFLGPALTIAGNGATVGYMHYADGFFNAYQRTYVLTELLGDRTFLFSTINRKLQKKIQQEARAGNIPYIVLDMLTELDIYLPSLEEQTQIGNFFKQLDDTIALHQREFEKFKILRKAYLKHIFIDDTTQFRAEKTIPWEQRKLEDVSFSYSGGTPSVNNLSFYGGSIPFIRSGEINDETTELFITEEGLNNSSAKLVEKGNILYALYGATSGEVGRAKIHGAINQAILAIVPYVNYDSEFIAQWLRRNKYSIISTYLQGGQGNLSGEIVKNLILELPPSKEEQTKIGNFFKQLDDTIALHQKELAKYQQIKTACLEKMFVE